MIKEWINISTEKDLKKLGKFKEVRNLIQDDLKEFKITLEKEHKDISKIINITSNSTKGLIEKIVFFKEFLVCNEKYIIKGDFILESKEIETKIYDNDFFISEAHELVFYLTQLDGEERATKLKVYKSHYINEELAKKWYYDIMKIIHPDKLIGIKVKGIDKAVTVLKSMYKSMVNAD